MESTRSSSKGQMVIPKPVREALGIRSGTELEVELLPGKAFKVSIRSSGHSAHVTHVRRLAGALSPFARGRGSARTDDAAILRAVAEDDARGRTSSASRARRRR